MTTDLNNNNNIVRIKNVNNAHVNYKFTLYDKKYIKHTYIMKQRITYIKIHEKNI